MRALYNQPTNFLIVSKMTMQKMSPKLNMQQAEIKAINNNKYNS